MTDAETTAPETVVTMMLEGRPVVNDMEPEAIESVADGLFDTFGEQTPALVAQLRRTGRLDMTMTLVAHPAGETVVAIERHPFHGLDQGELDVLHAVFASYAGGQASPGATAVVTLGRLWGWVRDEIAARKKAAG